MRAGIAMNTRNKLRLGDFLPYRLSVASNAVSSLISRAYEELFQLTIPEWRSIAILAEKGEATPLEISRTARMDKISVARATRRLQERGLMRSRDNPADRRSHFLSLTDQGSTLYDRVAPLALDLEMDLLRRFTAEEIQALTSMLRRLEAAALGE
jgi:DNA-binding MarR family transcriptional regulator